MDGKMQLQAQWEEARGRVKKAWGALTDDDLLQAQGNWDQLVATIRRRTGEGIGAIEQQLNAILDTISTKGKPK
jgi:uncharacterized protein YjbJ (UPF0337 family)